MKHLDLVKRYLREPGVEIGAFKTPIPGIQPTYVDRFASYANEPTVANYHGDACDLPFFENSVRYVATSHVLEHVANPLAAIREWHRVLKHSGVIYMVIPDRRRTFDHPRALTTPEHMLTDYRNKVSQCDGTHIDDFVYGIDWTLYCPTTPAEKEQEARAELASLYRAAVTSGSEINIHFHTFEPKVVAELVELGNTERVWNGSIEIVEMLENFPESMPNGFLVVARVKKPISGRASAIFSRAGLRPDASNIFR